MSKAEGNRQHLPIPGGQSCERIIRGGHVDLPVVSDLLDLPDSAFADEVYTEFGLQKDELLSQYPDRLVGCDIYDKISGLVGYHRQVLEVVISRQPCPSKVSSVDPDLPDLCEIFHRPPERILGQVSIWCRRFELPEKLCAVDSLYVHEVPRHLVCENVQAVGIGTGLLNLPLPCL